VSVVAAAPDAIAADPPCEGDAHMHAMDEACRAVG
jgi:hypothetical protein